MGTSVVRCAVAGATGLVGKSTMAELNRLGHDATALVRKHVEGWEGVPKDRQDVVDYAHLDGWRRPVEAGFCCLGTTLGKAGSQAGFRAIDFDAVLAFAKAAQRNGASTFALVSALGADPTSKIFYSRIKGETEEAVRALGFHRLVIVRPSLLLGDRPDFRLGERLATLLMRPLGPFLPGPLAKYRGVEASTVARAMVHTALNGGAETVVLESSELEFIAAS